MEQIVERLIQEEHFTFVDYLLYHHHRRVRRGRHGMMMTLVVVIPAFAIRQWIYLEIINYDVRCACNAIG